MKELILYIVQNIVSEPDKVIVTERNDPFGKVFYELEMSTIDRPYIIGKKGSTINAVRRLVSIKDPKAFVRIKD